MIPFRPRDQDVDDLLAEATLLTGHTALERMAALVRKARDELDATRFRPVAFCERCPDSPHAGAPDD